MEAQLFGRAKTPEKEAERIEKIRKWHNGRKFTIEHRKALSVSKKQLVSDGWKPWNDGLTMNDDPRIPRGGWNNNYICENCGSKRHVEIHHMNFNEYDNRPENKKKLCRSCHKKWHMDYRKRNGLIKYIRDSKGHILMQIHEKIDRGSAENMHLDDTMIKTRDAY
jgi:hypothetical protein